MCAMADSIALGRVAGFFESSIITTHPLKMGALQTEINCENKNAKRSGHYVKLLLTRGANLRIWSSYALREPRLNDATYESIIALAESQGYSRTRIERTTQNSQP